MESNFQISTADGSPSLQIGDECMHSLGGAISETMHVYGPAIDYVLANRLPLRFKVVGMGLAYIEYLILAKCRFAEALPQIESYESRPELIESLMLALNGQEGTFLQALHAAERSLAISGLSSLANESLAQKRWQIRGALSKPNEGPGSPNEPASAILYDPFSRRTSPELWSEEFLDAFLTMHASEKCVFSTYASFGVLKNTLKRHGFTLLETKGFGKKRESTFAIRD